MVGKKTRGRRGGKGGFNGKMGHEKNGRRWVTS